MGHRDRVRPGLLGQRRRGRARILVARKARPLLGEPTTLGLKPAPWPSGRVHSRLFVGMIDELALYDHPLAAEEVRRYYELATTGAGPSEP
jgi:hypothetical protein